MRFSWKNVDFKIPILVKKFQIFFFFFYFLAMRAHHQNTYCGQNLANLEYDGTDASLHINCFILSFT